jgi:hypothetical protein
MGNGWFLLGKGGFLEGDEMEIGEFTRNKERRQNPIANFRNKSLFQCIAGFNACLGPIKPSLLPILL